MKFYTEADTDIGMDQPALTGKPAIAQKVGIFQKTMAEYLAIPAVSSGLLHKLLGESPRHAWAESWLNQNRGREDSSKMDIGTFAHAMLLEGGHDGLVVVEADDWRTKAAKDKRDEARAAGKLPILAHKLPEVEAMVTAAKEYLAESEIAGVFDTGSAEKTIVFELDGVICKIRPDHLTAGYGLILSYKTTAGSANPESWIRTQLPSYDVATVFYERGVDTLCPEDVSSRCVHLVQEQSYPYACSLVTLAPAWRDLAERKLNRALALWSECAKSGYWPAYPSRICHAEPMPWEEQRFLEAEANRQQLSEDEMKGGVPL